ncbi:hypothetical protein, partial [Streptomyces albidochromogenes]|uniref:hypothetical protein n=1 Tax=Streptomyces albidochromogenes TaxID=329524 RepID=UPI00110FB8BE
MDNWRDDARSGYPQEPIPSEITVQLGTVRPGDLGHPPQTQELQELQEGSDGPVFVDASGRRSKKLRRIGWVLAFACACYAVTLVVALAGGNSAAPFLQIPGLADDKKKADTVRISPAPDDSASPGTTPPVTAGATPSASAGATEPPAADGPAGVAGPRDPAPGATASKSAGAPKENRPPATGGTGSGTNP